MVPYVVTLVGVAQTTRAAAIGKACENQVMIDPIINFREPICLPKNGIFSQISQNNWSYDKNAHFRCKQISVSVALDLWQKTSKLQIKLAFRPMRCTGDSVQLDFFVK